jgi:acyl carrier protein
MYGPTETTVWSTTHKIKEVRDSVSIGHPIANTEIYLLDRNLELVPIGMEGELCIGGAGVVRGYLNRPELTAEKFIPNPFAVGVQALACVAPAGDTLKRELQPEPQPGDRIYRTGDLVRYLPDGSIHFIGRMDHQVKLRGYRIELGEIEAVLNEHPTVGQSVVIAREDVPGDKRLVAYVTPADGQKPCASQLRSFLKGKLPEYMIPADIVTLQAFPQTPNRKIDRKALPLPGKAPAGPELAGEFPRTAVEKAVADLWAEVLEVPHVKRSDDFFRLGGDERSASRITRDIQRTCEVEVPVQTLFQSPVLADFAVKLEEIFLGGAANFDKSEAEAFGVSGQRSETDSPDRASRTPVEATLAGIWAELLHRDQVGMKDNFFELGGHSLIATQMVSRLRALFNIELPLRALFEAPTVAGLSAVIERLKSQPTEVSTSGLVALPRRPTRKPVAPQR